MKSAHIVQIFACIALIITSTLSSYGEPPASTDSGPGKAASQGARALRERMDRPLPVSRGKSTPPAIDVPSLPLPSKVTPPRVIEERSALLVSPPPSPPALDEGSPRGSDTSSLTSLGSDFSALSTPRREAKLAKLDAQLRRLGLRISPAPSPTHSPAPSIQPDEMPPLLVPPAGPRIAEDLSHLNRVENARHAAALEGPDSGRGSPASFSSGSEDALLLPPPLSPSPTHAAPVLRHRVPALRLVPSLEEESSSTSSRSSGSSSSVLHSPSCCESCCKGFVRFCKCVGGCLVSCCKALLGCCEKTAPHVATLVEHAGPVVVAVLKARAGTAS